MSEVGTPLPHNSDKPHGLVASITTTTTYLYKVINAMDTYLTHVIHKINHSADDVITIDEEIVWN